MSLLIPAYISPLYHIADRQRTNTRTDGRTAGKTDRQVLSYIKITMYMYENEYINVPFLSFQSYI